MRSFFSGVGEVILLGARIRFLFGGGRLVEESLVAVVVVLQLTPLRPLLLLSLLVLGLK